MEILSINAMDCVAILFAALSSFLLGGLWYSGALFGREACDIAHVHHEARRF